jgi:hypothetical protein
MHDAHSGYIAWREGRGEGCCDLRFEIWDLRLWCPVSPHSAPDTRKTFKSTVAWGEGGLSVALGFGAVHGVHSTSRSARFADGFVTVNLWMRWRPTGLG